MFPSAIATCSAEGRPNITYLSIVHLVDEERIALSNQFMSKTAVNFRENPQVAIRVTDPATMDEYDLVARYVRSQSSGDLFDSMRAQLDAVAAQVGIEDTFRLRGIEVLDVESCYRSSGGAVSETIEGPKAAPLAGFEVFVQRMAECRDLAEATR